MKKITFLLLFTFVCLGIAKGSNLRITTTTRSFSYEQQIHIEPNDEKHFFPGSTALISGYTVCGIEQTELYWSNRQYHSTFTYYLIPEAESDKIEYIYSDTEYSVGSSIEGRTILARSVAFNLPFTPSATSTAVQAENTFHYSPQGIVNIVTDYRNVYEENYGKDYAGTPVEGAYIYMYCVEKQSGQCGENAYWKYNSESATLTIYGEGATDNYNHHSDSPWDYFKNDIKRIEIESGITAIGDNAICYCNEATSIEIPNTVTKIGYQGIYQLMSLQSLTIPNSITEVGEFAFATCTSIKEIHIPASLTSIGTSAFGGCNSLETITVDSNNPRYNSNNNCNAIIETATNALIVGCKNTVIPDNVTKIGKQAFTQFGIGPVVPGGPTSITIPTGVTEIGDYAFAQCINLETIISHIPADGLFTPGYNAFGSLHPNCTLYVPAGAKETYAATEGWNVFTNIVEMIENPFELTVSAARYATLYLDYNAIIPEGVEVYTANTVDGNRLMMQQVTGTLPANTGVIVRAEQGTYAFEQSFEKAEEIEGNLLRGSAQDEYITPEKNHKYYVLSIKNGVVGMYEDALSGGTFKNNANKAYLQLKPQLGIYDEEVDTENPGMQLSNSYYFDFGGTTAIEPVINNVEDNIYYDLSGRRVDNPTRGIYIVNGKKVLVK